MKLLKRGKDISVSVENITPFGIWIFAKEKEYFLSYKDYPYFKALFEKILAVRSIPWAKTGLGKVHFLSKEFLVAKEIFQEVLEENQMYLEAADWLAKTLESLGNMEQAQSVLANAMELSPNSSARQKVLADVAYKNGALDLAQTSYEKAIKLGEYSVHKNSDTYAGLAKVLSDKDKPEEALKIIGRSREEFKDNPDALLQSAVVESMAYDENGAAGKSCVLSEPLPRAEERKRNRVKGLAPLTYPVLIAP